LLHALLPVIRSLEEHRCRTFYCGFLGFDVDFEHRVAPHLPLYLGLKRGPVLLHLSEHRGDATVWMDGVQGYRRELLGGAHGFAVPDIVDQPWGRELNMAHPFENMLRFCERPAQQRWRFHERPFWVKSGRSAGTSAMVVSGRSAGISSQGWKADISGSSTRRNCQDRSPS
jgi:hypothetical protein